MDATTQFEAPTQPPPEMVVRAMHVAGWSPCRSRRGAVVYTLTAAPVDPRGWGMGGGNGAARPVAPVLVGQGYNHKPPGFECDGSEACKGTCRKDAVHAEQLALLIAGPKASGAELLHVKVDGGRLAVSGPPDCVQCSKLIRTAGVAGVWLHHADGWRRYTSHEFHTESLARARW